MLATLSKDFEVASAEQQELGESGCDAAAADGGKQAHHRPCWRKIRWTEDMGTLESSLEQLVGDTMLGAAFLSYQARSPRTSDKRWCTSCG